MSFEKPTPRAIKKIRKKYKLATNDALSSKQYREALLLGQSKSTKEPMGIRNKTPPKKRDSGKGGVGYGICYTLVEAKRERVIIEVSGNLLSRNAFGSLSVKERMRYSIAHREAIEALRLKYLKVLREYTPMEYAQISFVFASKRGNQRDWDGNSETVKKTQDALVKLGFLKDDNPEYLFLKESRGIINTIVIGDSEPFTRVILERR